MRGGVLLLLALWLSLLPHCAVAAAADLPSNPFSGCGVQQSESLE